MADPFIPQETWIQDLTSQPEPPSDWLWHGFVARRNLTLLTSLWKSGKTTLLSLLLSRRQHGGQLAGLPVRPGKTVVVTEEALSLWADRARLHRYGSQVCFFSRPFLHVPTPDEWQALVDRLLALRAEHGIDLAVIDPLAPYLRTENSSRGMFDALLPLAALTREGLAVLLLHHPGRGPRPVGQAARGSGALLGHVDISIEMRHPGGDPFTRRRRLQAFSRFPETPAQLLLVLNDEGTAYDVLPDEPDDASSLGWQAFRMVLEEARHKLNRTEILSHWPEEYDKPNPATLWKWLDRAVATGMLSHDGTGRRNDPFRYWLPEREAVWKDDPIHQLFEEHYLSLRQVSLAGQAPPPAGPRPDPLQPPESPLDLLIQETPEPVAAPCGVRQRDAALDLFSQQPPPSVAAPPSEALSPEPIPPPAPPPATPAPSSPTPAPVPPPEALPVAPEPSLRLPYPFNIMNPAEVPAEVWQQARANHEKST
jgi:hypothetical protein